MAVLATTQWLIHNEEVSFMRTEKQSIKTRYQLLAVEQDSKTTKGTVYGYLTGILYLAPSMESGMGVDLCPMASEECRNACLYSAGMAGVFPSVKAARVEKTKRYLTNPKAFVEDLALDIKRLCVEAKNRGMKPAVRINGTSDQPKLALQLAKRFPEVQFYDYTKIPRPWTRALPNYHLTFSHSGENLGKCMDALQHGVNVAVVFSGPLPAYWHGYPVVDGDKSDLRFLDPVKVVVGLKAKGDARKLTTRWLRADWGGSMKQKPSLKNKLRLALHAYMGEETSRQRWLSLAPPPIYATLQTHGMLITVMPTILDIRTMPKKGNNNESDFRETYCTRGGSRGLRSKDRRDGLADAGSV